MGDEDEAGTEEIRRQKKELEQQRKALDEKQKELDKEKEGLAQTKKDKEKEREDKKTEKEERLNKLKKDTAHAKKLLADQQKALEEALNTKDSDDSSSDSDDNSSDSDEALKKYLKKKLEKKKKKKKVEKKKRESDKECSDSSGEEIRGMTTSKIKVPTLEKGMTYMKYKANVDMWMHSMKACMKKENMGMALLQSLPDQDNRGGLKDTAWKKLGSAKIASKDGVKNLLAFLDSKLLKADFVRCIELNDRHMAIKQLQGWSIDKYIAEAQTIWDQIAELGYCVPAPMKCATLIRGLNLTETQVHLISSKISLRAADLEDQVIDAIKSFADTSQVLVKKNKDGEMDSVGVNVMEDALGFQVGDEDYQTLLLRHERGGRGPQGQGCHYCKKSGHFKAECPEWKEKLQKIKEYKLSKGQEWSSPKSYALKRKAEAEKTDGRKAPIYIPKKTIDNVNLVASATSASNQTVKLFSSRGDDANMEYDSYFTEACDGGGGGEWMMSGPSGDNLVLLLEDNQDTAILDTGCAKSTAGEDWIQSHLDSLNSNDRKDVCERPGRASFRFGNGRRYKSIKFLTMPVYFGHKRAIMGVDVIEAKIPLLISLAAMKKAGTVIKTATDSATILNVNVQLTRTAGHYTLSLREKYYHEPRVIEENEDTEELPETSTLIASVFQDPSKWEKELQKLHSQMAHPPVRRIKRNLLRGKVWRKEMEDILTKIEEKCIVKDCRGRGERGKKPVVSFPRATRFAQSVAMDLKIRHKQRPILYMVDQYSRFTIGVIIKDKEAATIAEAILTKWVGAGYPRIKNIHTDNGGEFCGQIADRVAAILGATHTTTASRTPYQNGMCERIHQVLDHMMDRMLEENPKMKEEIALAWAVNSANSLNMESGYSPIFLVFGESSELPGVWTAGPSGLEEKELPELVARHLQAREAARKSQVQADTCIRLRRALRANIRPTGDRKAIGSWVYMKRMSDKQWLGPGQVWGQLGTNILVKQGSTIWHARHEDCIRVRDQDVEEVVKEAKEKGWTPIGEVTEEAEHTEETEETEVAEVPDSAAVRASTSTTLTIYKERGRGKGGKESRRKVPAPNEHDIEELSTVTPDSEEMEPNEVQGEEQPEDHLATVDPNGEGEGDNGEQAGEQHTIAAPENEVRVDEHIDASNENGQDANAENLASLGQDEGDVVTVPTEQGDDIVPVPATLPEEHEEILDHSGLHGKQRQTKNKSKPNYKNDLGLRSGMRVQISVEDGSKVTGKLLDRSTKAKGRYPNNFNVLNDEAGEVIKDVNFDKVGWGLEDDSGDDNEVQLTEEVIEILAVNVERSRHGEPRVVKAKQEELASLKSYYTYEEVLDSEIPIEHRNKIITTTWQVVEKPDRMKARICARGFQEKLDQRTDSPTASKTSLRMFLARVGSQWKMHSIDIKAAFLQGDLIDREVYVLPPKEFEPDRDDSKGKILWKLRRPLYGLADASRKWYCRVNKELTKLGCTRSKLDYGVYYYWVGGQLEGIVMVHVDDLIYAGTTRFQRKVIGEFTNMFTAGSQDHTDFVYVGWHLRQSTEGITLSQDNYVEKVSKPDMDKLKDRDGEEVLNEEEQTNFRRMVGSINWLAMNTRPDICFDAMELACNFGKARVKDSKRAGRILSKVSDRSLELIFRDLGDPKEVTVMVYADGSYGKLNGVDSCGGKFIALVGKDGNTCPITWGSNKFPRPARSALAAEAQAAADAMGLGEFVRKLWEEMNGMDDETCRLVLVTDSNSLKEASMTDNQIKDKRTAIDVAVLRRSVELGIYHILWRPGKYQLADTLTKQGANCDKLRQVLSSGIGDLSFSS